MDIEKRTTEIKCPRCGSSDDYNFDILSKKTLCTGCRETLYVEKKITSTFTVVEVLENFRKLGESLRKGMRHLDSEEQFIEKIVDNLDKQSDWKELDVNCLPEEWNEEGKYDFEYWHRKNEWREMPSGQFACMMTNILEYGTKYQYRLTPTKKSHEELAEEWASGFYTTGDEGQARIDSFIAGRKSMEGDIK